MSRNQKLPWVLVFVVTMCTTLIAIRTTEAQGGLPALEAKVAALETGLANTKTELQLLKQALDGTGLVRTVRQTLTVTGADVRPTPLEFPDRGPIAAILRPHGEDFEVANSIVVFNGGRAAAYQNCVVTMTGKLSFASCNPGHFDVLYIFSGPAFP